MLPGGTLTSQAHAGQLAALQAQLAAGSQPVKHASWSLHSGACMAAGPHRLLVHRPVTGSASPFAVLQKEDSLSKARLSPSGNHVMVLAQQLESPGRRELWLLSCEQGDGFGAARRLSLVTGPQQAVSPWAIAWHPSGKVVAVLCEGELVICSATGSAYTRFNIAGAAGSSPRKLRMEWDMLGAELRVSLPGDTFTLSCTGAHADYARSAARVRAATLSSMDSGEIAGSSLALLTVLGILGELLFAAGMLMYWLVTRVAG